MEKSHEFFLALLTIFVIGVLLSSLWLGSINASASGRSENVMAAIGAVPKTTGNSLASQPTKPNAPVNLITYQSKSGVLDILARPGFAHIEIPPNGNGGGGSPLLNISDEQPIGIPQPRYGLQWRRADAFQAGMTGFKVVRNNSVISWLLNSSDVDALHAKLNGQLAYPCNVTYTYPTGQFDSLNNNSEPIRLLNLAQTLRFRTFYVENVPPLDLLNTTQQDQFIDILSSRLSACGTTVHFMWLDIMWANVPERPTKWLITIRNYYDENGTMVEPIPGVQGAAYIFGWRDSLTLYDNPSNYQYMYTFALYPTSGIYLNPEGTDKNVTYAAVSYGRMPSFDYINDPIPNPTDPAFRGYELMPEETPR